MTQYVGLDVSLKETKLHVLDEAGNRIWRGRCATDPAAIAAAVRRYAPNARRIGVETGPLTTWLWTALTAEGLPNVRALIMDDEEIAAVIMPLLQARGMARSKCAALDRRLIGSVPADVTCRRLMTMPGVGPLTAVAYVAALERPDTFKRSRAVGAWLGLTPRRFQSGEVDYEGHISRRGDSQLRALLYEAAAVLLTRVRRESALRIGASCCGSDLASNAPLRRWLAGWRWSFTPRGRLAHHSIPHSGSSPHSWTQS
jgi:transposase